MSISKIFQSLFVRSQGRTLRNRPTRLELALEESGKRRAAFRLDPVEALEERTVPATLFWDDATPGGNADGGNGTWNTTLTNWSTANLGGANATWSNSNPDSAVFGGTAGTATLGTGITAGGLQFNTTGYIIDASSNALTFGATDNPVVLNNVAAATITGGLAGSGSNVSLTASNPATAGTLTLNGTSTGGWSGTTAINPGTTIAISGNNQALINTSGITLNGGGITLTNGGATTTVSGATTNSNTVVLASAAGITVGMIVSGTGISGTPTVTGIAGTTITLSSAQTLANAATINFVDKFDRVNDSAGISSNGGAISYANTSGNNLVYAETAGSVDLVRGQLNVLQTINMAGTSNTQTLTLSGLTRTGAMNSSAVAFGSATALDTTKNIIKVTGGFTGPGPSGSTASVAIIGPYASTGTAATNLTDYAVYDSSGRILAANISPTNENTWNSSTLNATMGQTWTLTGTRTVNTLRFTASNSQLILPSNFNMQTYGILFGGNNLIIQNSTATDTGAGGTPSGGGNLYLTTGTNATYTISAPINDNGGAVTVVKSGNYGITLSSTASNFSGGVVLNAGSLTTTADSNLGASSGGITVNGTATWNSGTATYNRNVTVNDGAILTINQNFTNNGVISGSGSITNNASNVPVMPNTASTFTGAINVNYGMTFGGLGDSTNPINFGATTAGFKWTGLAQTFALRPFVLSAAGTGVLVGSGTGPITIQQPLAFSGATGARTLSSGGTYVGLNTLYGTNTFAGNITDWTSSAVTVAPAADTVWVLSGTNTYSGPTPLAFSGGTGVLVFQGMQAVSNSSQLTGTQGSLNTKTGVTRFLDDAASPTAKPGFNLTYGNIENVTSADNRFFVRVFVGNNSVANGGTSSSTQTGSTIQLGNLNLNPGAVASTGEGLQVTGANNYGLKIANVNVNIANTYAGAYVANLQANSPLTVTGTVQQQSGTNTATTTLQLDGAALGNSIQGNILNSADGTPKLLSVAKIGTGSWTISGTNNGAAGYTGGTTVTTGKLVFSGANSLPATGTVAVGANGVLSLADGTARSNTVSALTLTSLGSLSFDWTGNNTGDQLTSTAAIAPTAASNFAVNLNLSGTPGGSVTLLTGNAVGSTLSSSKFYLANLTNYTAALTTTANTLTVGSYSTAGAPSAGTAFYWQGNKLAAATTLGVDNAWALSDGTKSNWSSTTTAYTATAFTPGSTADVIFSNSQTGITQLSTALGADVSVNSVTIDTSTATTIAGANGASLTLNGTSGTAATVSGSTITPGSAISVTSNANATSTISANVGLGANQTWNVAAGKTLAVSGIVSGGNSLTLAGAGTTSANVGTVTLSGANNYYGNTTISSGIAKLGAATTAFGSGAVTVSSGATLELNGSPPTYANGLTLNGMGVGNIGALSNLSGTASTYTGQVSLGSNSGIFAGVGNITLSASGTITGSGNSLTVYGPKNVTINSGIGTGSGGLTKSDVSTLTLTGTNTYTGVTTVNGGTLQVLYNTSLYNANPANWTAANINVASGSTLALNVDSFGTAGFTSSNLNTLLPNVLVANTATQGLQAGTTLALDTSTASSLTFTLGTAITDSTGSSGGTIYFNKLGANTLVLNQANTYSGRTLINAGTLQIAGSGSLGNGSYAGAILNNGALTYSSSTNQTLSGVISGAGTLTKDTSSSSNLTLSGANTFTGATTVNAGTLTVANNLALQNSALTFSAANPLALSGVTTPTIGGLNSSVNLASVSGYTGSVSALTLNPQSGVTATYSGAIDNGTGTMPLTKTGAGTQILQGNNGYTGATNINAGTLTISGASGALASTSIALGNGTFTIDNSSGNLGTRISDSATVTVNGNSALNFSNAAAASTNYTETIGTLALQSGYLTYTGTQASATGPGQTVLTFGALSRTGGTNTSTANFAGTGLGTNSRNEILFNSGVTNSTDLGPWAVVGGADFATYDSTLGIKAAANSTLTATSNDSTANWKLTGGNIAITASTNPSYKTLLSSDSSARTLTTTGNTVSVGGISSTGAAHIITGTGPLQTLSAGNSLYVNVGANSLQIDAPIQNVNAGTTASALVLSGGGTLILTSTSNSYSGGTILNSGTLQVNATTLLGAANSTLTFNGNATLYDNTDTALFSLGTSQVVLNNGAVATFNGNSRVNITIGGAVTGTGGVTAGGSTFWEKLALNSTANSFTGPITTSSSSGSDGNWIFSFNSINDSNVTPGFGNITLNSGSNNSAIGIDYGSGAIAPLTLNNRQVILGSQTGAGVYINNASSQALTINTDIGFSGSGSRLLVLGRTSGIGLTSGSGISTIAGKLTDNLNGGALSVQVGGGIWVASNAGNSYTGATTISSGTLQATSLANGGLASSIGASNGGAGDLILNGGTLRYTGAAASTDRLFSVGTGSGTIDASGTGAINFANTGFMGFNATTGARTLTLTGTNTGSNTIAGSIGDYYGLTALTKSNIGTWVLSGQNTNTGNTTFQGGGTLTLDYSTQNNSKIGTAGVLTLGSTTLGVGGGTLNLSGGSFAQNVASTTLSSGGTFITRPGGTSTLNLGTISVGAGANRGGSLSISANNIATTNNTNTNGILGGWAVVGSDWAVNSTNAANGPIIALTSYTALPASGASNSTNYSLTGSLTLSGAANPYSLKIIASADSQSLDLGNNNSLAPGNNTNNSNGIIYTANGSGYTYEIKGTGNSTIKAGASANGEMFYFVNDGTLKVSASAHLGSGALVKVGNGTLILNGSSQYGGAGLGATIVSQGALRLSNASGAGTGTGAGGGIGVQNGAALELDNNVSISKNLIITGTGINNGGALRNITSVTTNNATTYSGPITIGIQASGGSSGARINSDSGGSLTLTGGITTSIFNDVTFGGAGSTTVSTAAISGAGNLIKDGNGTTTLTFANTYTGATNVNGGRLSIGGSGSINTTTGITIAGGDFNYSSSTALTKTITFSGTGGTLSGTSGTINTPVTVTSGNTLAPGSSVGTLNFGTATNVTLAAGSFSTFEITGNATANAYDKVVGNGGTLNYGGTLNVTFLGGNPTAVGTYTLFNGFATYTVANGTFSAINLPTAPTGMKWHDYGSGVFFNYASGQIQLEIDATQLVVTSSAIGTTAYGAGITFTVEARNASNNLSTLYTGNVTVSVNTGTSGSVFVNNTTTTIAASGGVASFTVYLSPDTTDGTVQLTAASAGLTSADSNLFTMSKRDITASDISASDKSYDGNTDAFGVYGPNVQLVAYPYTPPNTPTPGAVFGDNIDFGSSPASFAFQTAFVGTNKTVTVAGIGIVGTNASYYNFIQPEYVTASITPIAPTVTTPTSASITSTSATLGGNVTSDGGYPSGNNITGRGIVYSTTNGFAPNTGTPVPDSGGPFSTGTFTVPATGLLSNTIYYYRAYATNTVNTSYSAQGTFTTLAAPSVTLNTANLANNASSFTISGTNFSTTPANNTVTFSGAGSTGITGSVTAATATSLTFTFTTTPTSLGELDAVVTVSGVGSSGAPVQVATVVALPTVTLNTANLANNASSFTISGTNFSTTPANNTVVFSGAGSTGITGSVTAATATSLTFTFTTNPTSLGELDAVVTVSGVGNSGAPVQVATVVSTVAAPTVTSVAPYIGPTSGGVTVVVYGANFISVTDVKIGSTSVLPANYTVNSSSQITVTSTAQGMNPSLVNITVTNAGGTSATAGTADDYSYATPEVKTVIINGGAIGVTDTHGLTPVLANQQSVVEQIEVTFNERVLLDPPNMDGTTPAFTITSQAGSFTSTTIATPTSANVAVIATPVATTGNATDGYTQYILTFAPGAGVNSFTNASPVNNSFTTLKDGLFQLNTINSHIKAGTDTCASRTPDLFWVLYGAVPAVDITVSTPLTLGGNKLIIDSSGSLADMYARFGSFSDKVGPPNYSAAYDYNLDGLLDASIDLFQEYARFGTQWYF